MDLIPRSLRRGCLFADRFEEKHKGFHMQMLTADGKAINFYINAGFEKAGKIMPMWVYKCKSTLKK